MIKQENKIVKFNKVSSERHLSLNKLMREHFSNETEFSKLSDIQKTQFFLGNKIRLTDTEEFTNKFVSYEEPTIESPKVEITKTNN